MTARRSVVLLEDETVQGLVWSMSKGPRQGKEPFQSRMSAETYWLVKVILVTGNSFLLGTARKKMNKKANSSVFVC